MNAMPITSIYVALFRVILISITLRVGIRRIAINTFYLDGDQ